jgi:hypothetical protein
MTHLCLLHAGSFMVDVESAIATHYQIVAIHRRTLSNMLHWANAMRREIAKV